MLEVIIIYNVKLLKWLFSVSAFLSLSLSVPLVVSVNGTAQQRQKSVTSQH